MRRFALYWKLACSNIKANRRMYVPYFLSMSGIIMMFFMLLNFTMNPGIGGNLSIMLGMGMFFMEVFSFVFVFYIKSFLMKRREKEFGLYNILGMEKKQVGFLLLVETCILFVCTVVVGIVFGLLFSKFMQLLIVKLTGVEGNFKLFYSPIPVYVSALNFLLFEGVAFLYTLWIVHRSKPIELLHAEDAGEKEPKTKVVTAIVGIITLGGGYFLAQTIDNPAEAIIFFLLAALLVIIGTYCLFSSISIIILKALRKNKKYYYQKNHFINVSGMIYRMKQNAMGLANICILSCMVIVSISLTLSVYFGTEMSVRRLNPTDISVKTTVTSKQEKDMFDTQMVSLVPNEKNIQTFTNLYYTVYQIGDTLTDTNSSGKAAAIIVYDMSEVDLGAEYANSNVVVNTDAKDDVNELQLMNQTLTVDKTLHEPWKMLKTEIYMNNVNTYEVFVKDIFAFVQDSGQKLSYEYDFDIADEKSEAEVTSTINAWFGTSLENGMVFYGDADGIEESILEVKEVDGSILFIGIFLSILFLFATVLIMYYKQVTEGYNDLERYHILQQVGLSQHEVKQSINAQIITVFFLPLIVAFIHILVAYHMETKMLLAFAIRDTSILMLFLAITICIFACIYFIVYRITSRVYYNIIKR